MIDSLTITDHHCDDLIELFNGLFLSRFNTQLVRGDSEPVYLPASAEFPHHRIIFAHGFYASALHEIAHWLVAGPERRLLEDFGYWYQPDGRSAEQQRAFEQVEVKPQALEWILARSAGFRFRTSSDNLNGDARDPTAFRQAVHQQVRVYLTQGLNQRTDMLVKALCQHYGRQYPMMEDFCLSAL